MRVLDIADCINDRRARVSSKTTNSENIKRGVDKKINASFYFWLKILIEQF